MNVCRHIWHKCHTIRHIRSSDKLNSEFLPCNKCIGWFLLVVLIIPQVSTQGASYIQYYGEGCDYRGGYRIWIKAACFHLVKNNASEKKQEMEISYFQRRMIHMVEKMYS